MEVKTRIRPGRNIFISIHENPESDATAFLVHGLGGRGDQWRKQLNFLKNRYTLVIPDLLGHGQSDKPRVILENPYHFSELDQDLKILFNHYSSNRNIILGHSYGGALATSLAMEHQDKVEKLILVSPTPCLSNIPIPAFYHLPVIIMECIKPFLTYQFQKLAFMPDADPDLKSIEKKANQLNPMYMIKQVVTGMQQMPGIDLTMLNIPALIIIGSQDKLISPQIQKDFYSHLPNHQFFILPNASHMLLLENPDKINPVISQFIES